MLVECYGYLMVCREVKEREGLANSDFALKQQHHVTKPLTDDKILIVSRTIKIEDSCYGRV